MQEHIPLDLDETVKTLARYVENGFSLREPSEAGSFQILSRPDASRVRPLKKFDSHDAEFVAVDCSARTLRRANNWGIYLLRASYAMVKNRHVDWGFKEAMKTFVGPPYVRHNELRNQRLEIESELAMSLIKKVGTGDYILLDGASYFGEKTGFRTSLFEECKKNIVLLAFSKQSTMLHDDLGRDFQAATMQMTTRPIWIYHPVTKANPAEHLYGDVSIVKLCEASPYTFRCDIMGYLTKREVAEIVSPLTAIAEDPRCCGYPVNLWLAHEFSQTSESKLLYCYEQIETQLKEARLYERLNREELAWRFADELHGARYPFEREWIEYG